jgi:hypothetical protein
MASVYRRTYKRPIPANAEIVTRKGQKVARWKDTRGRTKSAPLSDDGESIVLERRCWYIAYEGANGRRITIKGYTDREASETLGREKRSWRRAFVKVACKWTSTGWKWTQPTPCKRGLTI